VLRPETETSIPLPAKKRAAKSEFSSNISTTSDNEYSVSGPDSPIPELPFEGGFTAIDKAASNALARRTNGVEYKIVVYIFGRTTSAARRPEYADISMGEYRALTGATERTIYLALASLQAKNFVARDARGRIKVRPENFGSLPLPGARTCRPRPITAEVRAPSSIAALAVLDGADEPEQDELKLTAVRKGVSEDQTTERQFSECGAREECEGTLGPTGNLPYAEPDSTVGDLGSGQDADSAECCNGGSDSGGEDGSGRADGDTATMDSGYVVFDSRAGYGLYLVRHKLAARLKLTAVRPGCRPREAAPALKLTSVKPEANCKKPETYCPWNWACPHLSTASPLVSIETRNIKEPTTTGARSPLPAETENAYLARFLDPATRIGEALQIDDDAAGRMWRASIARNPELTPREFVLIVRMKLQEWRRVDDTSPGIRVRSLTGLLMRSMPSAVVGALHSLAREQAPADLERDCEAARAYLTYAVATPRDRAWARAILAEAESKT